NAPSRKRRHSVLGAVATSPATLALAGRPPCVTGRSPSCTVRRISVVLYDTIRCSALRRGSIEYFEQRTRYQRAASPNRGYTSYTLGMYLAIACNTTWEDDGHSAPRA